MTNEIVFICIIAIVAIIFVLFNAICIMVKRSTTAQTLGTVTSIVLVNPEKAKSNSKWATVTYKVNGKTYTSQNRIQVPMATQIGSTVRIRYDIAQPEKLYSYSLFRMLIALCVIIICIIAVMFKLKR